MQHLNNVTRTWWLFIPLPCLPRCQLHLKFWADLTSWKCFFPRGSKQTSSPNSLVWFEATAHTTAGGGILPIHLGSLLAHGLWGEPEKTDKWVWVLRQSCPSHRSCLLLSANIATVAIIFPLSRCGLGDRSRLAPNYDARVFAFSPALYALPVR